MKENMDFEKLLKAWAKVKSPDEESILFFSARPEKDEYTLFVWTKPKEEEGTEDSEEEGEEDDPLPENFYPGSENFAPPWKKNDGIPSRPEDREEQEEDSGQQAQSGSSFELKAFFLSFRDRYDNGPERPRATREFQRTPNTYRNLYRWDDYPPPKE